MACVLLSCGCVALASAEVLWLWKGEPGLGHRWHESIVAATGGRFAATRNQGWRFQPSAP